MADVVGLIVDVIDLIGEPDVIDLTDEPEAKRQDLSKALVKPINLGDDLLDLVYKRLPLREKCVQRESAKDSTRQQKTIC